MKKSILKSLEPQTRSLFRFKNFDNKFKANSDQNGKDTTILGTDPTATTTVVITHVN